MGDRAVYLLGGGGHGQVVLDAFLQSGKKVAGILDPQLQVGQNVFGVPVVGSDNWLDRTNPAEVLLILGVGVSRGCSGRRAVFEEYKNKGFSFLGVCHPSAVVGRESSLAEGCQIMAGAVLQCRLHIGENAVINTRASVDHGCRIGAHTFVSPGVTLCGDVRVSDDTFIGAGAVLLPGVQIGRGTVIGAGAVVRHSVPAGLVVAGNPAVNIGTSSV
jgi:UDP-perosamine 4-acetyltransferase